MLNAPDPTAPRGIEGAMKSDASEPPLDPVAERVRLCLELRAEGSPDPVTAACADRPELAERVRARLESLRAAGLLEDPDAPALPERLGDFKILALLGGGGMGVVYRALQESLGRTVALKLVRPEQLFFPGARERFRREVAAVARLSHPGIVPVYAFGEEQGVPFFAMEEVHGCTLAEVLESVAGTPPAELRGADFHAALRARLAARGLAPSSSPSSSSPSSPSIREAAPPAVFTGSWAGACAELARQVAVALDQAHRQGVLHRDVKPSNVLVTPDGRALVFDFGLALEEGVPQETRSGTLLGSLPYLAPEQLAGARADRRTDVYALGVTLYELLACARPYAAGTPAELKDAIEAGAAQPLRRRNACVPRDLESVVAQAMDPSAERRYASAADLARDLEHFLALRPVTARPVGPLRRLARWARRRPGAAAAAALAVVLVVGGPSGFAVQRTLATRALDTARAQAEVERARAEANLDRAVTAALDLLAEVGGEELAGVPGMEQKRRALLERALAVLAEVASERADDPALAASRARVELQAARVRDMLGDLEGGERGLIEAESALRALPGEEHLLADCLSARAQNAARRGRLEEMLALDAEAEALYRKLASAAPGDAGLRVHLANLLHNAGAALFRAGRTDEALALHERAAREARAIEGPAASGAEVIWTQGRTAAGLGLALCEVGRLSEAEAQYTAATELLERAAGFGIGVDEQQRVTLAKNYVVLLLEQRRMEDVERIAALGAEVGRRLLRDYPFTLQLRVELAGLEQNLAIARHFQGRPEEALAPLRGAVETLAELVRLSPESFEHRADLAAARSNLANLTSELGLAEEAVASADAAVALFAELCAERPGDRQLVERHVYAALVAAVAHAAVHVYATPEELAGLVEADLARDPVAHLLRACALARCASGLDSDPSAPEAERAARREAYLREALNALERSFELGYDTFDRLPRTVELAPLFERPEYRALVARYGG